MPSAKRERIPRKRLAGKLCHHLDIGPGFGSFEVFSRASQRRGFAWLAFAALCLNLVAPSVSRALTAEASWLDLGAWCTGQGPSNPHLDKPDPLHHGEACGYCALVAQQPLVPTASVVLSVPVVAITATRSLPTMAWAHALPPGATLPRGPPGIRG